MRSVGVEEELLLVDRSSGEALAVSEVVLAGADDEAGLEKELQREQVETATRPKRLMADLAREVRQGRAVASERAREAGADVAALATSVLAADPSLSPGRRFRQVASTYGLTAQEQLTCGCHVHVEVASDEEGVAVLDRIRPWLAPLLALSANSPFWQGTDTGYASYRSMVWGRWPSAGPVEAFGSARNYHERVESLLATGALLDEGMIYFDARLSRRYPTVEVRVADVCLEAETTVLVAALVRGLVETAARAWRAGEPTPDVPVGVLRLAAWRAGKSGPAGELVHPLTWRPAPARIVAETLVEQVADVLAETGDLPMVEESLGRLLGHGGGAGVQREVFARSGDLRSVVREAVARTAA
ncbi:glutamate--cysteine ligase [Streptomyces sp. NPDC008001]|uniref:glutamate--cysteine ligase n=1 Tax=Streptomyces sp. NPDC008001 TaxID=3364804 RepID=UPI0036E244FA